MTTLSRVLCAAACGAILVSGANAVEPEGGKPQSDTRPAAPASKKTGNVDMADGVLVTVNGKSFTRSMAASMIREFAMRKGVPPQQVEQYIAQEGDDVLREAIDQFIDMTLMQAEVERRAEKVTEPEIEEEIARISSGLPPGMTLTNALAARKMTLDELREQIVGRQRMRKLYEAEAPASNTVTDAEVAAFYKENEKRFTSAEAVAEARHILIGSKSEESAGARAAAKAEAESVRTQLVAGADFAQLAAAKSSCPSKDRGGSLGQIRPGDMVPEFDKAVFSQKVGDIGPVVETKFGYHVVQVMKRKDGGTTPLAEVSDRIRAYLGLQAREKRFGAYLKTLRPAATIVYPDAVKDVQKDDVKDAPKEPEKK